MDAHMKNVKELATDSSEVAIKSRYVPGLNLGRQDSLSVYNKKPFILFIKIYHNSDLLTNYKS